MSIERLLPKRNILLMTSQDKSEIYLYGEIGYDVDASEIVAKLDEIETPEITVYINSVGGDVEAGLAIYNALKRHPAKITTVCDGMACSAASVIFMAGDERIMNASSLLMIHNAWTVTQGNANDLRKQADVLEKVSNTIVQTYSGVTTLSEVELKDMLDAETWLDSKEALTYGFATNVTEGESYGYAAMIKYALNTKEAEEMKVTVELDTDEIVNKIVEALKDEAEEMKVTVELDTDEIVNKIVEALKDEPEPEVEEKTVTAFDALFDYFK